MKSFLDSKRHEPSYRNQSLFAVSVQLDQFDQIDNVSLKDKRIMLIEDEADIVILFKMILESDIGVNVDSFTEPFAALNNFRSGLYDLIMIDIVLPEMNGFELYYKIRKLDNNVKICFLTASDMYFEEISKDKFPELDTNHFIRKPISNEDFIQRVEDILTG
jgi:DNA-binding response OmpR family regulator